MAMLDIMKFKMLHMQNAGLMHEGTFTKAYHCLVIIKWIPQLRVTFGVEYCNKLFEIEQKIASLSVEEKYKKRQEDSKPIIEDFFKWVNTTLSTKIVVNNKLKKALVYAQNQEKELCEFLKDGRIPLSNNIAERCIRPFAVHRKNWIFADTPEGAKTNATFYSLIESAKINNLNVTSSTTTFHLLLT